jgi:hypothetical protein
MQRRAKKLAHAVRQGDGQLPYHHPKRFSGNGVDRVFFEKKKQKTFDYLGFGFFR